MLVVEKPPNLLSQGDRTGDPDLLTLLKQDLKERYQKPGNVYLGLVHRLDRPVGGVMVFAKTSKAAARLSEQIRTGKLMKTYLAVVHGRPKPQGRLVHYLVKERRTNTVRAVGKDTKGAKEAILDYEVLDWREGLSLVKIQLHTGRPHQIRVQLATIGCPLFGDQRYGGSLSKVGQQLALWSHQIGLIHPTLRDQRVFTSYPHRTTFPWNNFVFD